jgi:hypothetical protein
MVNYRKKQAARDHKKYCIPEKQPKTDGIEKITP